MSDNPVEQVLSDLFRYLEVLEMQNGAMLQLLKDKGVVSDDQFAPYLEKAATSSDVKWRAARARMKHLFASIPERTAKKPEATTKEPPKKELPAQESPKNIQGTAQSKQEKEEKETAARGESRPQGSDLSEDHHNAENRQPRADHSETNTAFASEGAAGQNSSKQTSPPGKPTTSSAADQGAPKKEAVSEIKPGQKEGEVKGQSLPGKKKEIVEGSDRQENSQAKSKPQSDNEAA